MSLIKKIWGIRNRLLVLDKCEIDLLYLDKNTTCSIHSHNKKINRFVLLEGKVSIRSELGVYDLIINEPFDVEPPIIHEFVAWEDSSMIELAFVNNGQIDPNDIKRIVQGGKIIDNKFYTLDELKKKNWLKL